MHDSVDSTAMTAIDTPFPCRSSCRGCPSYSFIHRCRQPSNPRASLSWWRQLLRSSSLQRAIWLKKAIEIGFTPTEADWSESAERIRGAMGSSSVEARDWRRYYRDAAKNSSMENRARIKKAVLFMDNALINHEGLRI
ncbi:hypothetical protein C8J56DRAFT_78242 [Mycena floridula]|nr:hypothetical protein C8J56DRAFT_78242 [Mycena floridula]